MPDWFIYAVCGAFIYSVTALIDKFILEKRVDNIFSYGIGSGSFLLIMALAVMFLKPIENRNPVYIGFAVLSGLMYSTSLLVYFKAVQLEDITKTIPFLFTAPLFTTISAYLFIREVLTLPVYLAIVTIVAGAVLLSRNRGGSFSLSRAALCMLAAAVIWGTLCTVEKYVLGSLSYWNLFSISMSTYGVCLLLLLFSKKNRKGFVRMIKDRTILIVGLNECLHTSAIILTLLAISLTKVGYVAALGSVQPFFILSLSILLTRFLPHIHREPHTIRTVIMKAVAIALIVLGAAVISLQE